MDFLPLSGAGQKAAEARLKALASKSTKVLFICEAIDKRSFDQFAFSSIQGVSGRVAPLSLTVVRQTKLVLPWTAQLLLVVFTNETKTTPFIDGAIDKALAKKISGVHVKAQPKSLVPSKATAYRWRSLTWEELEAIFSA